MGLTIELDPRIAEQIKAAAERAGVSVDAFVGQTLQGWLDDWTEDLKRLAEPGEDVDAGAAFDHFEARINERLAV